MATVQDNIYNTVLSAKCTAACWAITLINKENNGEDIDCCEIKMVLLVKWTDILQAYYFDNYSGYVGNITPTIDCLTAAQATDLMGKIKTLMGNGVC